MSLGYAQEILSKESTARINAMSPLAQQIADRWALGWKNRVKVLDAQGKLIPALEAQTKIEAEAAADANVGGRYNHLARHELMGMLEIDPAPPET